MLTSIVLKTGFGGACPLGTFMGFAISMVSATPAFAATTSQPVQLQVVPKSTLPNFSLAVVNNLATSS